MDLHHPPDALSAKLTFFLAVLLITLMIILAFAVAAEAVPPRPEQPHPDVFEAAGYPSPSLQLLNPVSQKAKREKQALYRLVTNPGCTTGTVPSDMLALEAELRDKVGFRLIRDDLNADFTVYVNCGTDHISKCGSISTYCLPFGFPYDASVSVSDIISTYYAESRLSVLCHEICGHSIGTWNEQYCTGTETSGPCKGLPRFTPTPGWYDFMNVGVLSRHGFDQIELERWDRTMYPLQQAVPEWGACETYGDGSVGCWNNWGGYWQRTIWNPATYRWSPNDPVWRCVEACP